MSPTKSLFMYPGYRSVVVLALMTVETFKNSLPNESESEIRIYNIPADLFEQMWDSQYATDHSRSASTPHYPTQPRNPHYSRVFSNSEENCKAELRRLRFLPNWGRRSTSG
jgi:hypothetical protein